MNYFVLSALCVIAVVASPLMDGNASKVSGKMVKIPDGFGGMKMVDLAAETEVNPTFDPPNDVRFLLFTRDNPLVHQELVWNDMATVTNSHFVANRKTIFVAHGWQSGPTTEVGPLTTAAYLAHTPVNVIVIDWSIGAGSINYITSRNHVNAAGAQVAAFANNLAAANLLDYSEVTCCGQSLGAHVCGAFGKRTNGLIDSIFGLDPAGPLFSVGDPANRLAAGDAQYVESVHTDTLALGIGDAIGDVDYYPNGGRNMPGCTTAVCDHAVAPRFHADTLSHPGEIWGRRCDNLAQMEANACTGDGHAMGGYPSNGRFNLRGIFRMNTNENPPLGQGPF